MRQNSAPPFGKSWIRHCLSPLFKQISHGTLCRVLERDTHDAEEVDIFRACIEWAGARCLEKGVPISVDKIREDLGMALKLVRFNIVDAPDLSNGVVSKGVLSDIETIKVFLALCRDAWTPLNLQFSGDERPGRLLNMTSVFITGVNRYSSTGGPYTSLTGGSIQPLEDVRLVCIYFANTNQEAFDKVQHVNIVCKGTGNFHRSATIRPSVVQGKPNNGFYNAEANFKRGVVLKSGHLNNITFHFDPPVTDHEIVCFGGTPMIATDDIEVIVKSDNICQLTGIGFKNV